MTYQVAEATRPLTSVSEVADKRNLIICGAGGGLVLSLDDHSVTPFRRSGNTYDLNVWVKRTPEQGFARQGK